MNSRRTTLRHALVLVPLTLAVFLALPAVPASAHVELVSSDPGDGATVAVAPAQITLDFSVDAEPVGDGIVLIDEAGTPLAVEVAQPSSRRIVLTFPDGGLENGTYGVRWTMRAGDAHPRSGSVTFRIDVPAPASAGQSPTIDSAEPPPDVEESTAALLPVIDAPNTTPGEWLGGVGRWLALLGALVGIGAFAFAATTLIGRKREVEEAGYWVRRAGVAVIVGTALEVAGASIVLQGSPLGGLSPGALQETLAGAFGVAVLLRLVGGAAMVKGTGLLVAEAVDPVFDPVPDPAPAGNAGTATLVREPSVEATYRLDLGHSATALLGVVAVALSYLFDGHTVTASPALVVRLASSAHVFAAGVWVGGVLLMAQTLTSRWRAGRSLHAAPLAIRFSRVASVALVVLGAAGLALAWSIVDDPTELVSTAWGRILIVKLSAVAIAAALGAHNHFVVIPALRTAEQDEAAADRLRRTVRIEGVVLLFVVVVTAILVGAAS